MFEIVADEWPLVCKNYISANIHGIWNLLMVINQPP